jgi:hypothetical protein
MKKVILLLVAVMISSVGFAKSNPHGVKTGNNNDASVFQLGMFNKAHIDQTDANYSLAQVHTYGFGNEASIKQVGFANVAGGKIMSDLNPCSGFCAIAIPDYYPGGKSGICMSSVDLACCDVIPHKFWKFDINPLFPGIYAAGENNTATIWQEGHFLVAGIVVMGENNTAGINQKGWGNMASLWVQGKDNHSIIKQGYGSMFNAASVKVKGHGNITFASQYGFGNRIVQNVRGKANNVYSQQCGVGNVGYQKVRGHENTVLLDQAGWANKSVQFTTGHGNTSLVKQNGMMNQATIVQ